MMARGRKTPTPLDRLEAIRQRRLELAHKRDQWERKRTEAERALTELPDRRREAMDADAEQLPSGEGLQATVNEAKERIDYFRDVAERRLDAEEHAVIDASCGFFDELAEKASQEAEQELQKAVESAQAAQRAIRAAVDAWGTVRRSRLRNGRDGFGQMLPADFAGVTRELEAAQRLIWPGARQSAWEDFRAREASRGGAQKLSNAEAAPLVEVIG